MVELGWKAGPEQYSPVELLDYAIGCQIAGFDSIDVSDHFQPWSEAGQACFTWTWLGAAAVKTSRIRLGTGLTCPILRYHPSIVAQAAATLSCFAPGRTFLGVGTGEALNEYSAVGLWPGYRERQERLAEAITLIRALWTGDEVTYRGKYYQTRKARLYTPPANAMPIYVSSLVPGSATFAGEMGDGLLTVGGKPDALYREMVELFDKGVQPGQANGRTRPRMIELNVAYAASETMPLRPSGSSGREHSCRRSMIRRSTRQRCPKKTARSSAQTPSPNWHASRMIRTNTSQTPKGISNSGSIT